MPFPEFMWGRLLPSACVCVCVSQSETTRTHVQLMREAIELRDSRFFFCPCVVSTDSTELQYLISHISTLSHL